MKLSDYKNEEALDVLADILEPASAIIADEKVREIFNSDAPKVKLAAYVVKHYKKEIIQILARLDGMTPETYHFTLLQLPGKVLELVNDPELQNLFMSQGQMTE